MIILVLTDFPLLPLCFPSTITEQILRRAQVSPIRWKMLAGMSHSVEKFPHCHSWHRRDAKVCVMGSEGLALVWKTHPGSLRGAVLNTEAAYSTVALSNFFKNLK